MHNNLFWEKCTPFLIVSLQANIWNTSYDEKSQQHLEVGIFPVKLKSNKVFISSLFVKRIILKSFYGLKNILDFNILFNSFIITLIDLQVLKKWG